MGRYGLIDKLGEGSMGVVYRAYDELLGRYVALKTMASDMNENTELRQRFYQEAQLAAKLNHPYIITVYDLGEIEGQIYIAMELLEGKDLKSFINEGTPLPLEQKLDWMIQLAEAFAFAHGTGIVHRDIKPGNIHIRKNRELVVMDFGIARAPASEITRAGVIIGTPEYISPEQIMAIPVDHRADIFSLGLVFYEMLTDVHPFRNRSLPATIHKVLNEKPAAPHELNSRVPKKIGNLVMKMLEKDPKQRHQDCQLLLQDLLSCRDELSRQASVLLTSRDIINVEILTMIGRLQDLYSRKEFLKICEELHYDPSTGTLGETSLPEEPTYSQATEAFAQAQKRLNKTKHYIESSAQLESVMRSGKALYAAQQYAKCIEQMNIILAYYPNHELATEYIQQCQKRLSEREEADEKRRQIILEEQTIMNLYHEGDITNCQREALVLLKTDPENTIAKNYLNRCEEKFNQELQEAQKNREVEKYLTKAKTRLAEQRYEECMELLSLCEEIDPDNAEVNELKNSCTTEMSHQRSRSFPSLSLAKAGQENADTTEKTPLLIWLYPVLLFLLLLAFLLAWWLS
jgi:serine/threonine protein kinase